MTPSESSKTERRSLVEAAAWRVHLTEAGDNGRLEEFEIWRHSDPRNEAAWRQIDAPWQLFGDQAIAPEVISARRAALRRAQQTYARRGRRPVVLGTVAALLALSFAMLLLVLWQSTRPLIYRTALGERRAVMLADGSTIALDAETEVRVRYSDRERYLTLVRGQAQFDVVHDALRPFEVTAADRTVIATGTSFNVDLFESQLRVTLIRGRVVVVPDLAPGTPLGGANNSSARAASGKKARVELREGEQLVVTASGPLGVATADLDRTTSWQSGRLVFEDETLSAVATRMSRYTRHPFRITDQETARLRISGVFHAEDVEGFISTITTYFPVTATPGQNGEMELHWRN